MPRELIATAPGQAALQECRKFSCAPCQENTTPAPAKTATLSSVSPVFSLVLEILFLKEKVTTRLVLGVGLCLVGVWIVL